MRLEIGPPVSRLLAAPCLSGRHARRTAARRRSGPTGASRATPPGSPFRWTRSTVRGDPDAGTKVAWNFDYRWQGTGQGAHAYYSYWDRGEELPLYYEGTATNVWLAHRPEPQFAERDGDMFRDELRKLAYGVEVLAPFDAKGIALINYRYKSSDGPHGRPRRTTTPGSTCRRCAAFAGSRPRSAPTRCPAPTSRSTTSRASSGSSRSTTGAVSAAWTCSRR